MTQVLSFLTLKNKLTEAISQKAAPRLSATIVAGLLLVLQTACQSSNLSIEDYWSTRKECGLDRGEFYPVPSGADGSYININADCAGRLAEDLGLSWEGFGEYPREINVPSTTAEILISGQYTVLSSDVGIVEDADTSIFPGELLNELQRLTGSADIEPESPLGAFWYIFLRYWIENIIFDEGEGKLAYYDNVYEKTMGVFELTEINPAMAESVPTIQMATIFVHEAAHGIYPDHEGSFGDAYTVQAIWLREWIDKNIENITAADCEIGLDLLGRICLQFEHQSDYEICITEELTCPVM